MTDHLDPDTASLLKRAPVERAAWIQADHWVPTKTTRYAFQWMEYMFRSERCLRPMCMQVIGAGGGGKSALLTNYAAHHPAQMDAELTRATRPVLLVDCLGCAEGPKGLCNAIARAAWPGIRPGLNYSMDFVEETLMRQQVRLLLLDEAADVLVCGPALHKRVLSQIKLLNTRLQINIVTATVHGMDHAFAADKQLHSRFARKIEIQPWKEDQECRNFLVGFERFLPFSKPSRLDSASMLEVLLKAPKTMDQMLSTIKIGALWALSEKATHITSKHLERAADDPEPPPIGLELRVH